MAVDEELAAALPVKVGSVIAGKYRIDALLAAGGMGAVFKAHHEILDKGVAIKLMRPELATHKQIAQRFLREARAAAKITSDFVARVTDVDLLDDKTPYMVMDLLEGEDLAAIMEAQPRLPIAQAVDFTIEALFGLEAAHARGVVHRDLKPSNLFVERLDGGGRRVKVLDFGISKVLGSDDNEGLKAGATTGAGQLLGTPRYMSPEQVASAKNVDLRTDLWSLGMILYEMLVGAYPFEGASAGAILAKIVTAPIPKLGEVFPDAPAELEAVVSRALAKERDDRYASAGEMIAGLTPFASKRVRAMVTARGEHAAEGKQTVPLAVAAMTPHPTPTPTPAPNARAVFRPPTPATRVDGPASTADTALGPGARSAPTTTESGVGSSATPSSADRGGSIAPMFTVGVALAVAAGAGIYFFAIRTPAPSSVAESASATLVLSATARGPVVSLGTTAPGASTAVDVTPSAAASQASTPSAVASATSAPTSTSIAQRPLPVGTIAPKPVATGAAPTGGGLIRTRDD